MVFNPNPSKQAQEVIFASTSSRSYIFQNKLKKLYFPEQAQEVIISRKSQNLSHGLVYFNPLSANPEQAQEIIFSRTSTRNYFFQNKLKKLYFPEQAQENIFSRKSRNLSHALVYFNPLSANPTK